MNKPKPDNGHQPGKEKPGSVPPNSGSGVKKP